MARGELTEEEARIHPRKNVLTRAVGVENDILVDTGRFAIEPGDVLLLATDGLMNMVPEAEMIAILSRQEGNAAQALVDAALASGGRDNVTAIVVVHAS